MKNIIKYFLCFIFFTANISFVCAQQKQVIIKEPKFKPPVVKTYLGVNQNGATVTATEASQLVGLPLKIIDAHNNQYPVQSYQFLYRQKSFIQDDETGKKKEVFTIASDRFNTTPLPKIWVNSIKDKLQKDEQLYFFDIVVRDKQGRSFFAPEIKITIQ